MLAVVAASALTLFGAAPSLGVSSASSPPRQVRFLTGPSAGKPLGIALAYLKGNTQKLGVTASDLSGLAVTDQYTDAGTGTTHIYLQQRYQGIGVYNGITDVNIAKDGSVINVGNRFVSDLAGAANGSSPGRAAKQGVKDAAGALGLGLKQEPVVDQALGGLSRKTVFDGAGISLQPIPAKLVYVPGPSGVRLAWNVTIDRTNHGHWWSANVDASTGDLLSKADYVDNESYNVFAPPKDSPLDGDRSLEVNPFDPFASPFGWHDTDGAAGAESTLTIGNNVHAATDLDHNNLPDAGSEPDGGASLLFDSPLDLATQQPADYRPAAVTNLFYWNNYLHDVSYHYGFTEAAGNFQENDYGRGGVGGDSVNAEADGGGQNNANFGTPPDGLHPRMQMFVWTASAWAGGTTITMTVHAPAEIAGDYTAAFGNFGTGTVTADVALPSGASKGCFAGDFSGFPSGNIALIDRGDCTFSTKIRNAQDAGASAVIVANNAPGVSGMPQDGTPNQPTIPAFMISQADGATFKANLPGVNATVGITFLHDRDSDLDNGVMAHEYTHGISNRLTGGPSTTSCLQNAEEGGEGWSDFMALVLTAKTGETGTTQRPVGSYVSFGAGLRDFPYTTDIAVNPQTYDAIKTNGDVHFTGAVWAETLWEVYWNLVNQYGFDPNILDSYTHGGNNLALQLVMDGLKLQPCSPGFVDARDGILLADQNLTGGANQCLLWQAFAKRGLGENANQGSSNNTNDGTEDFTVPASACDTTAPDTTIVSHPSDPSNTSFASFSFVGDDGSGSGVASFECSLQPFGSAPSFSPCTSPHADGVSDGVKTFQVRAIDTAGNVDPTPAEFTWTIDTIAPADAPVVTGTLGNNGWYTSSVSVAWHWTDGGSGIDTAHCTQTSGSTGDGSSVVVSSSCKDLAGNSNSDSKTFKIDTTKPQLAPTLSTSTIYLNQAGVTASPGATDTGGSGVASSSCGAINTSTVGDHTVTCTATDNAGNSNSSTIHYTVGYKILGFFSPAPGSKWKTGQTVPVKIALADVNGVRVSDAVGASLDGNNCRVTFSATGGQSIGSQCLKYDSGADQFVYNWKLAKNGTGTTTAKATVTYPGPPVTSNSLTETIMTTN